MNESLPRHAWDGPKRRRKGALPWTWPPAAHAARQGQEPQAQVPAQPPAAPRSRRHFGGRATRVGGTPPARLPGDARSAHARNRGLFVLGDAAFLLLGAILIWYLGRRRR